MTEKIRTERFCSAVFEMKGDMYAIALSILKNKEDSEDAVQQTLYKAYERLDTLRFTEKFKPWILKILTNECYAVIRGRNKSVPTDDIEEVPDKETETEEKVTLWETVSRLKLEQRTVILLFYYQDLSIKEISKVLGISEDTVKKRLSRAREALRQSLEEV